MYNIDSLHTTNILGVAEDLIDQGFSVIPIQGDQDKSNPKKPLIPWKQYQKRAPTNTELPRIIPDSCTAIAVVCGQVSELMVIDFDDLYTYQKFRNDLEQYSHTFTVKTRRGYHLYFRVQQYIPSQKFDGGDIKAEKSYVIAPPSIIRNYRYHISNSSDKMSLNPEQVDEILNYLQVSSDHLSLTRAKQTPVDSLDLLHTYDQLMPQIGRNNALYRVSCIAANSRIPIKRLQNIIVTHHVKQPTPPAHHPESFDSRYIEALNTIKSAYTTKLLHYTYSNAKSLPNSIREYFLQTQSSTILPRLLDIFRLAHWRAGRLFSMAEAITLANKYGLNRKSVMKVLTGELSVVAGKYIIVRSYVEYHDNRGRKFDGRGRPVEILYEVPSVDYLMRTLNVEWSPSDKITVSDVKSAHLYRLALHREYIKRVAPTVPLQWLAQRLGVNVRSIQRYNQELDVHRTQNLAYFTLAKSNLASLPKRTYKVAKNATNGFWLETSSGNRYPAWRHIGSKLLKTQCDPVTVCVQKPATLRLDPTRQVVEETIWEAITPAEFLKIQAFRSCKQDQSRLMQVVDNLFQHVKKRLNRARFYNLQLHFDSVVSHIAKDDIAETITSYLFAYDRDGELVRRPAKRGIAYRMLKEFGNGNVYLALLDSHTEMFYSLARHAINFGYPSVAMKFLMSALD